MSKKRITHHPSPFTSVVLGGAGAMGRIAVKDLFETAPAARIIVADYDLAAARKIARSYRSPRVAWAFADIQNIPATARLLQSAFAVLNTAPYQWNLHVMRAALSARCHYLDLGGLFHMTRKQLRLDRPFKNAGLTAILGIGAAPGITNLLARSAAEELDRVSEIHCLVGNMDKTKLLRAPPLHTSYSIDTILDEFSCPPAVFTRGRFRFPEPMSGQENHSFPEPVGEQKVMYTLHSEVATLPLTYRRKGIREVSFKIGFGPEFTERLRLLRDLGLASRDPLSVGGIKVIPRRFLVSLIRRLPQPVADGPLRQHEVLRSVVKGVRNGKTRTWTVDCHVTGVPRWGIGLDADTGCPPSIAAQMLARGEISQRGVFPPEIGIPLAPFFKELEGRGMKIRRETVPTHSLGVGKICR